MKTETQLFTISDLATRKVSVFYDVSKHTPEQLNTVLGAAFPADVLKAEGNGQYTYYFASTVIKPTGRWTCGNVSPAIPEQSLELFEL
jgi:hypothetical protein